jgi:hypothetical protein
METPVFVISADHSYLGVYPTPEEAARYLSARVADDPSLQKQELHFFDGLGHRIDVDHSAADIALRGALRPPAPEDLHRRINEALRLIGERLESEPDVVKNRRGDEFPTAEVLARVRALQEKTGPDVPFHEMVPAVVEEFLSNGDDRAGLKICKVTCSCCG